MNEPLLSNFNNSLVSQDMNTDLNKPDDEIQLPQTAVVPNLLSNQTEMKCFQQVLTQAIHSVNFNVLFITSVADNPVSE